MSVLGRKPNIVNHICAYPEQISCVLGAGVIIIFVLRALLPEMHWPILPSDWLKTAYLLIEFSAAVLAGCLLGIFLWWPWFRPVCCIINGAPLKVGDTVLILVGPHKGTVTHVYRMTIGQGGYPLAIINLDPDGEKLFDEFALYKPRGAR